MSAVCPVCGVAVVPGYVRCPKCHAGLPGGGRAKRSTAEPSGTSVAPKGFPMSAVAVAVGVAGVIILVFGLRSGKKLEAVPVAPAEPIEIRRPVETAHIVTEPQAAAPELAAEAAARDQHAAALELEDTLHRQRLWGRVEILGQRVDLRSGSCADKAMKPVIEGARSVLHGAGLTKLRCVEQSGAVVFERDL